MASLAKVTKSKRKQKLDRIKKRRSVKNRKRIAKMQEEGTHALLLSDS
jgi:hypothetical protein